MSDANLVRLATVPVDRINRSWVSKLLSGGDTLNTNTLDLCGGTFPSEQKRTARRQTLYGESVDVTPVSNEVVAYKDDGIQLARAEMADRVAHCPSGMVQAKDLSGGMASYRVQTMVATSTKWLPGTIAIVVEVTRDNGNHYFSADIFQFRGNVMSVVYGPMGGGQLASDETLNAADAAAALLMAAIPDSSPA